jgi:hypothetical protein
MRSSRVWETFLSTLEPEEREALERQKREQEAEREADKHVDAQARALVRADKRNSIWSRVGSFRDVGLLADGSLFNPRSYPEAEVRAAIQKAQEELRQRRSAAAQKASVTRGRRHDKRVAEMARRIASIGGIPINLNAKHCQLCGKHLSDPESMGRGVGSECWQGVLAMAEQMKNAERARQVQ